jgi:uncharacterized delta-60 repeat protein
MIATSLPGSVRHRSTRAGAASVGPLPLGLLVAAVLLLIFAAVWAPAARAADAGDLDTSFGSGGKTTLDIAGGRDDFGTDAAIQPDGKVVVAGSYLHGGLPNPLGTEAFALVRFNPGGSPDTSFGNNGRVTLSFAGDESVANAVAIQPNGRIVAAGWKWQGHDAGYKDFALARFTSEGKVDKSFSDDGRETTTFAGWDAATDVAIQPDGKIVAVGGSDNTDFAIARYDPDGTPDEHFDGDGKKATDFGANEWANAVEIQPTNGKIVVAGGTGTPTSFALARYNTNGTLDTGSATGFDGDGKVVTGFGGDEDAYDVAIQPNGKIVAAGKSSGDSPSTEFALARYNTDGSLDTGATGFDGDGKAETSISGYNIGASAVEIQDNGRIVAAGWTDDRDASADADFELIRYHSNGALDNSFDDNGKQATGFGGHDYARAVAIQPGGKIVAAGSTSGTGLGYDLALARYHAVATN